ncbi:MAG TPA: sensor histidine kinase, partial [Kaistia sp.]|nr:sensor histidine kinase [Kaistia sp.]
LATQTIRRSRGLSDFNDAFVGRLHALSRVHGLLTRSNWTTTTLDAVAREALAPHGVDEASAQIRISGPPGPLSPRTAQAFSLLFHELGTNAAKYGALAVKEGAIDLTWEILPANGRGGRLTILWHERGGPPVASPERRGFGSLLIEQTVRFELKGDCALS